MSNHAAITKTMKDTSRLLVQAIAEDRNDPRVDLAAEVIADLAEYVYLSVTPVVTMLRCGYHSPSLRRQLDDAIATGPDLDEIEEKLVFLHSNITYLDAERARRRGATRIPGA